MLFLLGVLLEVLFSIGLFLTFFTSGVADLLVPLTWKNPQSRFVQSLESKEYLHIDGWKYLHEFSFMHPYGLSIWFILSMGEKFVARFLMEKCTTFTRYSKFADVLYFPYRNISEGFREAEILLDEIISNQNANLNFTFYCKM